MKKGSKKAALKKAVAKKAKKAQAKKPTGKKAAKVRKKKAAKKVAVVKKKATKKSAKVKKKVAKKTTIKKVVPSKPQKTVVAKKAAPAPKKSPPSRIPKSQSGSRFAAGAGSPQKFALCIGIDNYTGVNALRGCVNDAAAWATELNRNGFVLKGKSTDVEVNGDTVTLPLLVDKDATGAGILGAIDSVLSQANAGDFVVIQYSGHGSFVRNPNGTGVVGCICPIDVISNGVIRSDELDAVIKKHSDVDVLIIADSCYAGGLPEFSASFGMAPSGVGKSRQFQRPNSNGELKTNPLPANADTDNRLLLASCDSNQPSWETSSTPTHGLFTSHALATLANFAKTRSYDRWHAEINSKMDHSGQTPILDGPNRLANKLVFA